ncbi:MAG: DUF2336 domain-containing protein [Alphaproteobacteria bacterium]|nr:DUF2336 domain-containing protein [Alphaproteobacteria bacterium]
MTDLDGAALFALARDKSPDGRRALVEAIGSLSLNEGSQLTERERGLMFDILGHLVHETEMSVRRTVSACLAELPDAPRDLIRLLANDDIEIAYPVLTNSGVLQDDDLIEVIRHRTQEHQLAVTIRQNINESVSEALVETGNENVIRSLLKNTDAKIARSTMEYLVEQSKRVDSFQEPILQRRDLDPELVKKMFTWVSTVLRQLIVDDWDFDAATVDSLLERATAREVQSAAYDARELSKTQQLTENLESIGKMTPETMLGVLKEGEVALFIAMFTKFTALDEIFVRRMLFEHGGNALAITCKAAGIGKAVFASIFALTRNKQNADEEDIRKETRQCLAVFNKTTREKAMETVRRWQANNAAMNSMDR